MKKRNIPFIFFILFILVVLNSCASVSGHLVRPAGDAGFVYFVTQTKLTSSDRSTAAFIDISYCKKDQENLNHGYIHITLLKAYSFPRINAVSLTLADGKEIRCESVKLLYKDKKADEQRLEAALKDEDIAPALSDISPECRVTVYADGDSRSYPIGKELAGKIQDALND